jgi:hypothetical protein
MEGLLSIFRNGWNSPTDPPLAASGNAMPSNAIVVEPRLPICLALSGVAGEAIARKLMITRLVIWFILGTGKYERDLSKISSMAQHEEIVQDLNSGNPATFDLNKLKGRKWRME